MPSDEYMDKYTAYTDKIRDIFLDIFGEDMVYWQRLLVPELMGLFVVEFKYLPLKYNIALESQFGLFGIEIVDSEGAKNGLYAIVKYNNETELENIEDAAKKLKMVLEKNDFYFYITKDDITYRKKGQTYERIEPGTDWSEC